MITYYDVLGVSPKASGLQIKKAYKERVKKIHPDVVHDDAALWKMKRLNRAYAVLRNNTRRAEYDVTISSSGMYRCETTHATSGNLRWLGISLLWLIAVFAIGFFSHPLWDSQITSLSLFN